MTHSLRQLVSYALVKSAKISGVSDLQTATNPVVNNQVPKPSLTMNSSVGGELPNYTPSQSRALVPYNPNQSKLIYTPSVEPLVENPVKSTVQNPVTEAKRTAVPTGDRTPKNILPPKRRTPKGFYKGPGVGGAACNLALLAYMSRDTGAALNPESWTTLDGALGSGSSLALTSVFGGQGVASLLNRLKVIPKGNKALQYLTPAAQRAGSSMSWLMGLAPLSQMSVTALENAGDEYTRELNKDLTSKPPKGSMYGKALSDMFRVTESGTNRELKRLEARSPLSKANKRWASNRTLLDDMSPDDREQNPNDVNTYENEARQNLQQMQDENLYRMAHTPSATGATLDTVIQQVLNPAIFGAFGIPIPEIACRTGLTATPGAYSAWKRREAELEGRLDEHEAVQKPKQNEFIMPNY